MYLLAPTAAAGAAAAGTAAAKQSLLVRALSSEFLVKWGAPGANMFQSGFSLDKRLINFAYKGTIFAAIGMAAGTVGTAVSNGLLALRKQLDPTFTTQNEPPTVLGNAACWALHMGISSNLRYQMLGGIDGVSASARTRAVVLQQEYIHAGFPATWPCTELCRVVSFIPVCLMD